MCISGTIYVWVDYSEQTVHIVHNAVYEVGSGPM